MAALATPGVAPRTPTVSMKDLLQGGVHFGHQTRRWNPKMKPYIFAERGGIYIIDLMKTTVLIDEAYAFVRSTVARGGSVLFVGTKKQCQEAIKEQAERTSMPYVSNRWLGGLLTNFSTISRRIRTLHELRQRVADGSIDLLPTREAMKMKADLVKLEANLGGVAAMERLPQAVFVIDPRKEQIVVKEARKLGIPIVALVDTNCDPDEVDYIIPGNDDAIRSCSLIIRVIADAVQEGQQQLSEHELRVAVEREKAAAEASLEAAEAPAETPASERPERRPAAQRRGGERRGGERRSGPGVQRRGSGGAPRQAQPSAPIGRRAPDRRPKPAAEAAPKEALEKAETPPVEAPAVTPAVEAPPAEAGAETATPPAKAAAAVSAATEPPAVETPAATAPAAEAPAESAAEKAAVPEAPPAAVPDERPAEGPESEPSSEPQPAAAEPDQGATEA